MPFLSKNRRFFTLILLFWCTRLFAQNNMDSVQIFFVKIDSIVVEGNKITRKPLILRELDIQPGDSIAVDELDKILLRNRNRVVNLQIFNDVTFVVSRWNSRDHVSLRLKVREAWYWFPSPVFELVDRNFNVWWTEFNRSLKRTNYGGDYTQKNITGHADIMSLTATAGYNQRFSARYLTPTINRKQTIGMQLAFTYARTREVAVRTLNNKLVFFSNPEIYAIQRYTGELSLTWRPGLFHFHSFLLEHRYTRIADTIANEINPDFFAPGVTTQQHNSFVYTHSFDNRDIRAYPMHGWNTLFEFRQNGLLPGDDLFLSRLRFEASKFTSFNKWLSLETGIRLRYSLPRRQPPYFNNQSLGYGADLVRGYEYYVMDGLDLGVVKTSVRAKFFNRDIHYPKLIKKVCSRCKFIGTEAYISILNDFGYAYDPWFFNNNALTNRPLYATGVGLDLVFYKRSPMQIAWMQTVTGQQGVFFRTRL